MIGTISERTKAMGDTYIEEMVARKSSIIPTILYVVLGAVCAGSVILGIMGAGLFYSIALFAGLGIYFVHYLAGVEYEYLYVDKSLSVDKIIAKRTRKRIASFDLERMECFAPFGHEALKEYNNRSLDTKDYSSGYSQNADKRYVLIYDGQKKVILEPSERMLEAIYTVSPRKVFIKK